MKVITTRLGDVTVKSIPLPEFDEKMVECMFCEGVTSYNPVPLFDGSICNACRNELLAELNERSNVFYATHRDVRLGLNRYKKEQAKRETNFLFGRK